MRFARKKRMISSNAIQYTLSHLLKVAFPLRQPIHFTFEMNEQHVSVRLADQYVLEFARFSDEEFDIFRAGKWPTPLRNLKSADGETDIPVFAPARLNGHPDITVESNRMKIPFDLITPSFLLLSREEEGCRNNRDAHDRFRYENSLAHHYGFIHLPLVDEYAMLLRKWVLEQLTPDWPLFKRTSQLIPTHDIDLFHRFQNPWQAFKSIVGRDLLIERNWSVVQNSFHEYKQWRKDTREDPYTSAIHELADVSKKNNLNPVFFFKAQIPGESDFQYSIDDPLVSQCISTLQEAGAEVGLHGSYGSYNDAELFCREKERLEKASGGPVMCVRQHYLRYSAHPNPPKDSTLQIWQKAGIHDDYTLGFAEQPGFRCGTCHPFPLYDTENDRATNIIEHPLIVMDGSLFDYLHLNITDSNALIDKLLYRCQVVEGDFIILWHNHLLSRSYRNLFENIYLPLIQKHTT